MLEYRVEDKSSGREIIVEAEDAGQAAAKAFMDMESDDRTTFICRRQGEPERHFEVREDR